MSEHRFIVFDRLSRNQLGEFATRDAAEECLLRFVRAEPDVAPHLEIWDDKRGEIRGVDPEKIAAVTACVVADRLQAHSNLLTAVVAA